MTDADGLTGRQLLASGGGAGAGVVTASSLLETLAAATLSHHGLGAIEHIVVFRQESRRCLGRKAGSPRGEASYYPRGK